MRERIWDCKIGGQVPNDLPNGADLPMRNAVERAYREITGLDAAFNFSGWGGTLTEFERAVVENREPADTPHGCTPSLRNALESATERLTADRDSFHETATTPDGKFDTPDDARHCADLDRLIDNCRAAIEKADAEAEAQEAPSDWSCGHVAGAECAECAAVLRRKLNAIAARLETLCERFNVTLADLDGP